MVDEPPPPPPPSSNKVYKTHFKNQQDQELIRLALHKSPFFSCLDEEQLERLVETFKLKIYPPGEIVILEGCVDNDDNDSNDGDVDENKESEKSSATSSAEKVEESTAYLLDDENDDTSNVDGPAEAEDYDFMDDDADGEENRDLRVEDGDSRGPTAAEKDGADDDRPENLSPSSTKQSSHDTAINHEKNPSASTTAAADPQEEGSGKVEDGAAAAAAEEEEEAASGRRSTSPPLHVDGHGETVDCTHAEENENKGYDSSSLLLSSTSPTPYAEKEQTSEAHPPPPRSGITRSLYIVRKGHAGVWYQPHFSPASLGPGTLFGEGGFLFGRQHSASIRADDRSDTPLECWVVDHDTFRHHVLPSNNMKQIFHKYAHKRDEENGGAVYMTMDDFVQAVEDLQTAENSSLPAMMQDSSLVSLRIANTYSILRRNYHQISSSTSQQPRIYLDDFCFFHFLMARPDPEVDIAFLLMDEKQTGQISLDDLAKFLRPVFPDLDFQSQFFERYFGKKGNHSIRQTHFSQFLADLPREMGKQAFLRAVQERGTPQGYLNPPDFLHVLRTACGWRLPQGVSDRLEEIYCRSTDPRTAKAPPPSSTTTTTTSQPEESETRVPSYTQRRDSSMGDKYFAYGDFLAFQEVLGNLPFICNLIDTAQEMKKGPLSPDDFKVANRVQGLGGRLSRRQVDIVFHLFDLDQDGYVSFEDTVSVCGVDYARRLVPMKGRGERLTFAPPPKYRHDQQRGTKDRAPVEKVLYGLFHLGIAATVGGVGIGLLYPLDFVKTRLMNQRIGLDGSRMYRNALDCIQQAFRAEGFAGLYRGLVPSLLGVAPERAIKLQVHNLLIQAFHFDDEESSSGGDDKKRNLWLEALAGGCAGASQLLVTNPMELAKIRLQLQGETSRLLLAKGINPPSAPGFIDVIRDLGFPGIYRGASACLLRDVPFAAIYFPAYAACKDALVQMSSSTTATKSATPSDILLAGTLAGIPAAFLTTPADVVKTRLQVIPRPGETSYTGISDCATRIYRQEGIGSFFRGSLVRTARIAPQFGISILAYEGLAELLGFQRSIRPPTNLPVDAHDYHAAFVVPASESGQGLFGSMLRRPQDQQSEQ